MLVDVTTQIDPHTETVLKVIGAKREAQGAGSIDGVRLQRGLYLCTHWSLEYCLPGKWQAFVHGMDDYHVPFEVGGAKCERPWESASTYGVCDSPSQFMELIGKHLDALEEEFVVSFVRLRKEDEPPNGGWRWHKWGPYIGTQKRECEYLAHEEHVEEIYTYHFYRRVKEDGSHR